MAKKSTRKSSDNKSQKPIEQYEHKDKQRLNNPPVGLVDAHTDNGGAKKKQYAYDPHLDPQLQWAGKAEHTSFEVPTVSLHVHERIDPRRIIETVRKEKEGWATLAKNLKAEIDEEKIQAFGGTTLLPFTPGKAVAVKIIDARGIESLKIIRM